MREGREGEGACPWSGLSMSKRLAARWQRVREHRWLALALVAAELGDEEAQREREQIARLKPIAEDV